MRARPSFGPSCHRRKARSPQRRRPGQMHAVDDSPRPRRRARERCGPAAPGRRWRRPNPREGTTGCTRAFSSAIRASSVLARTPEYPHASTFARSAIVARTARLESGSPTPAAWLRSRFNCSALKRVVRDPHVGERSEAGVDAVDGFVALGLARDHSARRVDARPRGLGETDRTIVVRDRGDILQRERLTIEEHHASASLSTRVDRGAATSVAGDATAHRARV